VLKMQDRYVGDVGDFVKYGLLRHLSPGFKLGVAWYLYRSKNGNNDGKHDSYLRKPAAWSHFDRELFDAMQSIRSRRGGVADVEAENLLNGAVFSGKRLNFRDSFAQWGAWRRHWFEDVLRDLRDCNLVFADPDNGLCLDEQLNSSRSLYWKRLPKSEAEALASGRCAVFYHHNTRRKGGHAAEIEYWLGVLPAGTLALRARVGSARTFFVVNPSPDIEVRLVDFARVWAPVGVELHPRRTT